MNLKKLSINQLSELTGLDRRTISAKLKNAEMEFEEGAGGAHQYETQVALAALYGSETRGSVEKQMEKEKLRYETARADKAELDLLERRREVIPISEVAQAVEREYSFVRAQILSMPSKLAKPLAIATDPANCLEILQIEIDEVLKELQADANYQSANIIEQPVETVAADQSDSIETQADSESGGMVRSTSLPVTGEQLDARALEDIDGGGSERANAGGD